jgi:mannose-6-phosphate isomerase-like protein (cupin superfamily)
VPHSLTREEVFVVLEGTASVTIGGVAAEACAGDAIVVPAGAELELANGGGGPLRLLCCLPVGGEARTADGASFVPPWAQ